MALDISFEWLAKGVGEMTLPDRPMQLKEQAAPYHACNLPTPEQQELLDLFDKLNKNKRSVLMNFVRDWIEK